MRIIIGLLITLITIQVALFAYIVYNDAREKKQYEEISSNINSINEYLNEPVAEVTEEQYEAILNAIK